jgi:hypothetical protein
MIEVNLKLTYKQAATLITKLTVLLGAIALAGALALAMSVVEKL